MKAKIGTKVEGYGKLTKDHLERGVAAHQEKKEGKNPASWVEDEDIWDKAKEAANKTYDESEDVYWPAVAHIYESMGGEVKSSQLSDKAVVKAAQHSGTTPLMQDAQKMHQAVSKAIQEDDRFDTDEHGYPEDSDYDKMHEPYVLDILSPDENGKHSAVIRTDDGRLVRHGFDYDHEKHEATMHDGESKETHSTQVYSKEIARREKAVKAAGSSSGASKGHAARKTMQADEATKEAHEKSAEAHESDDDKDHEEAANAHEDAHDAHEAAYKAHAKAGAKQDVLDHHMEAMKMHKSVADFHRKDAGVEASEPKGIIHCRESGVVFAKGTKWELDKPARFQYMPGGLNTIQASYGGRAINLTVEVDESTAKSVNASIDEWYKIRPKQVPFGCVEHRQEEAAIRFPKGQAEVGWSEDPEPGVFCTGLPTELGARNVNGRIHGSWSPSFTTDADYVNGEYKDNVLTFPDGVRGSKTNPAKITGVDFAIGTLTNKPAFKNILPVRAKQADNNNPQPETKHAGQTYMKVKFIKARGSYSAGAVIDLPDAEANAAIKDGDALDAVLAKQMEDRDSEIVALKAKQKSGDVKRIEAALTRALKRGALFMDGFGDKKLDTVRAAQMARYESGNDAELIAELIDHLPGNADKDLETRRTTSADPNGGNGHVWAGQPTVQEVCLHTCTEREGMRNLLKNGGRENIIKATEISRDTCALLKAHVMSVVEKGGDIVLKQVVKAANTDVTDPNSQVGTLSATLILMRNLGFLKNKLAFMPYISTDLRNEPARFGQNVLTRYITPPAVLTFVPGIGYTSDVTTINNYITSRGTNLAAVGPAATALGSTQTTGTQTLSAPSTNDVNVAINNHLATEINFPTSTLGGTIRNLFAEQREAQMYALAEITTKVFLATVFSATWSGVNTTALSLGNFSLPGTIKIKTKFSINKMPDVGRFALLHTFYHDALLTDATLLTAKALLAMINKDESSFESGELPPLFGVKYLESQLAAFNSSVNNTVANSMLALASLTDPTTATTVAPNGVGFAGNSASALFVARIPEDYTQVLPGIPATAALEIVTEPDSGLSLLFTKYVNHSLASVSARAALMFGFSQGDPRQGFVLIP